MKSQEELSAIPVLILASGDKQVLKRVTHIGESLGITVEIVSDLHDFLTKTRTNRNHSMFDLDLLPNGNLHHLKTLCENYANAPILLSNFGTSNFSLSRTASAISTDRESYNLFLGTTVRTASQYQ